jgi:hypothetical protein
MSLWKVITGANEEGDAFEADACFYHALFHASWTTDSFGNVVQVAGQFNGAYHRAVYSLSGIGHLVGSHYEKRRPYQQQDFHDAMMEAETEIEHADDWRKLCR